MSKERGVLIINPVTITGEELGKVRDANLSHEQFKSHLPEFCLRKDNGYVDTTAYYHQFTFDGKEPYMFFDVIAASPYIDFEIEQGGFDDFMRAIDMRPVFNKLKIPTFSKWAISIPMGVHLVFDLEYQSHMVSWPEDDMDVELTIKLIGYLDNEFKICDI